MMKELLQLLMVSGIVGAIGGFWWLLLVGFPRLVMKWFPKKPYEYCHATAEDEWNALYSTQRTHTVVQDNSDIVDAIIITSLFR